MKNYYHILGLSPNADLEEIKTAYRKLSKKFHPDVNNQDKYFEEMFKEIQEAYETLTDSDKRRTYDRDFQEFFNGKKTVYEAPKQEPPRPQPRQEPPKAPSAQNTQPKTNNKFSWGWVVVPIIIAIFSLVGKCNKNSSASLETQRIQDSIRVADSIYTVINKWTQNAQNAFENKNYDEAIIYLKNACEISPNDPILYKKLGAVYFSSGVFDTAIECYLKAITINPQDADAYISMGVSYSNKGDNSTANKCFQKAAQLGDNSAQKFCNDNNISW